ncbi:MAG: leucine-rich repeat protein [Clostridia bacterium]|nr:leucine-rich repeat protein [Clostridia bacterium]
MEQFLCKTCGQPLVRQGNNYICNYCGNAWVADLANDIHAVERANAWEALRRGDFEKATELFDEILLKNNNDYEALWGKALSLNAILYVIDLSEDKRVPTCNNITENSFISSNEVKKAISIAPSEVALSYKKQAEYIEKVRLEWLEKASKEPEYDVFISFKDSDRDNGIERTQDSIDAQDLYNLLTAEGLKVFFSRISLRNKISEQYEPYIYNAIKTAKVMIVFGEKVEYFTAPWIKNEWRRYLSRIESAEKHKNSLVVVYKDINVGELPKVLSSKQCLNYEDVTFSLTLVRHIKGIIEDYNKNKKIKRVEIKGGEISKKATSLEVNQIQTRELGANSVQTSINDAQKLSLVDTYLGESMFSEAQKLLNEVLIESPNSGEAIYKSLQIKYKKSPATSVNQADLALLEKAILNSAKEKSANILNKLYSLEFEDNITEALLKTILPFEYEGRTSQINLAFEKAIKKHNYKTFCLLLKTLNANEVDRYIDYNMRYVHACEQEENVIACLNNVISVDGGNVDALDKLYKLQLVYKKDQQKALEIFEELLKYSKNPEQKIKECIQYLNDYFNPSYCGLIKKILSYSSADISEYKKIILNSANKALLSMNFEVAEQLISIITTENEQDPEIYWDICLIKTKSISAENIVNSDIALNSLPEFQKYLLLASEGDRKTALDIVKRQTQAIERKRKEAEYKANAEAKEKARIEAENRAKKEALEREKKRVAEEKRIREETERKAKQKLKTKIITISSVCATVAIILTLFFTIFLPQLFISTANFGNYVKYKGLTEYSIPEGTVEIKEKTFRNCKNLKSIVIPEGVTTISKNAFEDCTSLESIVIPNSVTSIGSYAFLNCNSLKSITLSNSLTTISNNAFEDCASLESIVIPKGVTIIKRSAFRNCKALKNITIPDSVTTIEEEAFIYCSSLDHVVIPNGVTDVGRYLFGYCTSLKSVSLSENTTTILCGAFRGCTSLETITIPAKVDAIEWYAFENCSNLENIYFEDTTTWYHTYDRDDYEARRGGNKKDVTANYTTASYFTSVYPSHWWYKL